MVYENDTLFIQKSKAFFSYIHTFALLFRLFSVILTNIYLYFSTNNLSHPTYTVKIKLKEVIKTVISTEEHFMFKFTTSSPEKQGIASKHIINMIERLENLDIPMHSILISRNDELIYEGYYKPYDDVKLHRIFSISKTFTSLAIGHLITLGKLHLDDHIIDHFPEKCPADIHPWIKAMTIRNMLEMRTCHSATTYKNDLKKDWVGSFFTTSPDHPAGTVFHYDTSSPHVLCALVEKLTGKPLYTYIREDVLPELELSEDAFMLQDPFGVSMGGSGLCCTSMDLMKIGYFLLHEGNLNGRQVIDKDFLDQATGNLNPTIVKSPLLSENQGYGFQIWRHARNGFAAYGMGGQFIIVVPEKNLICVTTADNQGYGGGNPHIHAAFFEEILDKISDTPIEVNEQDASELATITKGLAVTPVAGASASPYADKVNGVSYKLLDNKAGLTDIQVTFGDLNGTLSVKGRDFNGDITFGIGHMTEDKLPICDFYYVASAAWLTDQVLYIKCHLCDTSVGNIHIQLHFEGDQLTVYQRVVEETMSKDFPPGHFIGYCK